ncbi:MAG: ribbon-helix-helix protein, CopG family, partial [Deltaproteobacteria bacterium]|nr:ribbon-helix-helix protein, CopG family [Deltaproteobacteria bacterium]
MNKTITIRLNDELRKDLEEISRIEDKSISDLVRESLKNYIAVRKFRRLREKTLPLAEAQGLITDEDI